jgi:sugar lactone lactonase YvrE
VRRWLIFLLVLVLLAAAAAAWVLTREPPPLGPWVGVTSVLADDLTAPFGIAPLPDGGFVVSDATRILRIAPDDTQTTLATGLASPSALALAPDGSLVVADTGAHVIRRVTMDGAITTIAGDGTPGFVDGPAAQARFSGPVGVAVDRTGRIIVADTYNDRIRAIDPDGTVRTIAGGAAVGTADGPGALARFDTPCGVAIAPDGRILVADTGNGLLRAIAPDGTVSTLATTGVPLERPMAVAAAEDGELFIADESGIIVAVSSSGQARIVAGNSSGFQDGEGDEARFRRPSGIALADDSRLLVTDAGNGMVRTVRPIVPAAADARRTSLTWPWRIDLPAPPAPRQAPAFDADAFAHTALLWPIAPLEGPHEVAGTFGEARGEVGAERLHAGLDVREVQGTLVRAVRDSLVESPFSTFGFDTINEGVRIGDVAYIHIRAGRTRTAELDPARFAPTRDETGEMTGMRVRRGARFRTGDVVGTINAFNHVHLNVGWSSEEHNPLRFRLVQFRDGIPPTIEPHGIRLFDEAWSPLNPDRTGPLTGRGRNRRPTRLPPAEPVVVSGRVRVVVDAWDQADGNMSYRRLGLHSVAWQVIDGTGGPVAGFELPRETLSFDRMRRDSDAPRQVYARGSGIPVYGASRTQFLYVATTTYRDGRAEEGVWDTFGLAPGPYVVRVIVRDFSGNQTSRDLRVEKK